MESDIGYLQFLVGNLICSCYGCWQSIRLPPHVPPPPYVIVTSIYQKEYRTCINKEGQPKLTLQPQNVHYHCWSQCILRKHEDFDNVSYTKPHRFTPFLSWCKLYHALAVLRIRALHLSNILIFYQSLSWID